MGDIKVAVCGIGKMENHYIREWVEHYQKLGFDNVILIDNNDEDGERYEDVIGDYIENGFVILEDYRGKTGTVEWKKEYTSIQIEAYNEIFAKYRSKYNWIAFFDIDEFLMLENEKSIKKILADKKYDRFDYIKICWKYYDDNDLVRVENNDFSVVDRFTRAKTEYDILNTFCKHIVRCKEGISFNSAHLFDKFQFKFCDKLKACDALGRKQKNGFLTLKRDEKLHKEMWLNHYRTKTLEEYIEVKIRRGWPDDNSKCCKKIKLDIDTFFLFNEKTEEKERYIEEMFNNTDKK